MSGRPDRSDSPDATFRRARFTVPPPASAADGVSDRLRLVDPTGCAVAWLGFGGTIVVLGFFVRDPDGAWREVLRDHRVETGDSPTAWTLLERDPTMARLSRASGGDLVHLTAGITDGVLTIADAGAILLVAGDAPDRS